MGAKLEKCVADFIRSTFKIINTNKIHMIASSFALSRETLIPEMFLEILNQVESMLVNIRINLSRETLIPEMNLEILNQVESMLVNIG